VRRTLAFLDRNSVVTPILQVPKCRSCVARTFVLVSDRSLQAATQLLVLGFSRTLGRLLPELFL
jgi:hypothetical protein